MRHDFGIIDNDRAACQAKSEFIEPITVCPIFRLLLIWPEMKLSSSGIRRAGAGAKAKTTARFTAINDMPVRSRVAEVIKEAIFSGVLKPGDALRELHLAAELNVSQASVREGLVQLENAGMVA